MDRKTVTFSLMLTLLTITGCAKDEFIPEPEPDKPQPGLKAPERLFSIFANFPEDDESRATSVSDKTLTRCWATAFNHENKNLKMLPSDPYFQHEEFDDTLVVNEKRFMPKHEVKCRAPYEGGLFEFFASYPSAEEMSDSCGVEYAGIDNHDTKERIEHNGYFMIDNKSVSSADSSTVTIDYAIANFLIAPDIAKQVDFMTARSKTLLDIEPVEFKETDEDSETPQEVQAITVTLDFEHQLSSVELKVWGNNDTYLYEIAGVRLGNIYKEGKFKFNTLKTMPKGSGPAFVGSWVPNDSKKGIVEYIYKTGDKIVKLDGKTVANAKNKAVSIMGKSNFAMLIPGKNAKWVRPADPGSVGPTYTTPQSYFSVLMRVSHNKTDGKQIYPYTLHSDEDINGKMAVVWLAVENTTGKVIKRVYTPDKEKFFTDEDFTQEYIAPSGVSVKDFGWAAAPIEINWEPGKSYSYNLNYSNGIGLHDPSDPEPGTTILEQNASEITFDLTVSDWGDFTKETIPVVTK